MLARSRQYALSTLLSVRLDLQPWTLYNTQIVAGLEPENTNTFLQMLGLAARQYDGEDAVEVNLFYENFA